MLCMCKFVSVSECAYYVIYYIYIDRYSYRLLIVEI